MLDETKYPHFIPDKPQGEDVFEGRSQEHLAASICNYIKSIDVNPDKKDGGNIPRIIGLEGGWGSGKSNVVRMIGGSLVEDGYYSFTYDAWGHQEDLQRRSILETLTKDLTSNDVLSGKVSIKTRTGDPFTDTWEKQLQLLLSNKTIIKSHSIPSLSWAAIWAVLIAAVYGICLAVADKIIGDECPLCYNWWIYVIPFGLTLLIGIIYLIKDGSLENAMKMANKSKDNTTTFQYTSSEEPSISEFKNWMQAISDALGKDGYCSLTKKKFRKLIIVFDNMDRLHSDKVMQLWSCIYTFFAGGEFENVWTIIPYDYKHLCQAIMGNLSNDDDEQRIKHFINKTFPITYIVPQPVITDYEILFNTYFDKAFGPDVHDKEHICQVFMHLEENPNPRTVIRFVNELVAMRLQWSDKKYRLQNQALYILKKDFLFYAYKPLDMQLLSDGLFDKVSPFYPEQDKVRTELCQYAYGLDDEKFASETPLRNELKRRVETGESIADYVANPSFLTVFETVLAGIDQATLNKAVKSLASLDGVEFSIDAKDRIRLKWDFLANMKARSVYDSHQYDETLTILINHATTRRVINMSRNYVSAMQRVKVTDGASYFHAQHKLQQTLQAAKIEYDDSDWYQSVVCAPEQFIQYVCTARDEYDHYGLTAESKALNEYLLNGAMSGNSQVTTVIDYIKDDEIYELSTLRNDLAKAITEDRIKQEILAAAYVHRVLNTEKGIMKVRFSKEIVSSYLNRDQAPWAEKLPVGLEDVIAMYLADGNDVPDVDETILPRLSKCIERYIDSNELLTHMGSAGTAYNKLNAYMIKNKKGQHIDIPYYAKNILIIRDGLGLDVKTLLDYGNDWEYTKIEDLTASNIQEYLHQELFADYLACTGEFTEGLIKQGIGILETQDEGFLIKISPNPSNPRAHRLVVNPYWKQFVLTFVGTNFIPKLNELLTKELITMLKRIIDSNAVEEQELLSFLLSHEPVDSIMREYLNDVMNNHFTKFDVSVIKFKEFGGLLPELTSDMDINTARNLAVHFIKPVYKDKDCAQIIVANKDFYFGVLKKDTLAAQEIFKGMMDNGETSDIYEVIKEEIDDMIIKEEDRDSSEIE